jgi:hypothetical protein
MNFAIAVFLMRLLLLLLLSCCCYCCPCIDNRTIVAAAAAAAGRLLMSLLLLLLLYNTAAAVQRCCCCTTLLLLLYNTAAAVPRWTFRCNLDAGQRVDFVQLARSRGVPVHLLLLSLDPGLCARRAAARRGHEGGVEGGGAARVVWSMAAQARKAGGWG